MTMWFNNSRHQVQKLELVEMLFKIDCDEKLRMFSKKLVIKKDSLLEVYYMHAPREKNTNFRLCEGTLGIQSSKTITVGLVAIGLSMVQCLHLLAHCSLVSSLFFL